MSIHRKTIRRWDNMWNCSQTGGGTDNWTLNTVSGNAWNKYATSNTPINEYAELNLKVTAGTQGQVFGFTPYAPGTNPHPTGAHWNIAIGVYYDSWGYCGLMINGAAQQIVGQTMQVGDLITVKYDKGIVKIYRNGKRVYTHPTVLGTVYYAVASHDGNQSYKFFEQSAVSALITKIKNASCGVAHFNAVTSYGYLPFNLLPDDDDFTFEMAYEPYSARQSVLFSDLKDDYTTVPVIQIYRNANGSVHFCSGGGTPQQPYVDEHCGQSFDFQENILRFQKSGNSFSVTTECPAQNYSNTFNLPNQQAQMKTFIENKRTRPYAVGRRYYSGSPLFFHGNVHYIRVYVGTGANKKLIHAYEMRNLKSDTDTKDFNLIDEVGTLDGVFYGYKYNFERIRDIASHGYCQFTENDYNVIWGISQPDPEKTAKKTPLMISPRYCVEYDGRIWNYIDGDNKLSALHGDKNLDLEFPNSANIDKDGAVLNGVNQYGLVPLNAPMTGTRTIANALTNNNGWGIFVSFIPKANTRMNLWQIMGSGSQEFELGITTDGLVGLYINGYLLNYSNANVKVNINEINTISVRANTTGQIKMCVNGVVYTYSANTAMAATAFNVGRANQGACYFQGIISKIRFFFNSLTEQQMKALHNGGKPI